MSQSEHKKSYGLKVNAKSMYSLIILGAFLIIMLACSKNLPNTNQAQAIISINTTESEIGKSNPLTLFGTRPLTNLVDRAVQLLDKTILLDPVLRKLDAPPTLAYVNLYFTGSEGSEINVKVVAIPGEDANQWLVQQEMRSSFERQSPTSLNLNSIKIGLAHAKTIFQKELPNCEIKLLSLVSRDNNLVWEVFCSMDFGNLSGLLDDETGAFNAPLNKLENSSYKPTPSVVNTPTVEPEHNSVQTDLQRTREKYMRTAIDGMSSYQRIWLDEDTAVYLAPVGSGDWTVIAHHLPTSAVISYDGEGREIARNTGHHPDAEKYAEIMSKREFVKEAVMKLFGQVASPIE